MKRWGLAVGLSLALAFPLARAQDDKKPDPAKPGEPPRKDEKRDANKAPNPREAKPVGQPLAAGTVKREKLYPLDEGRSWHYELKTWLATTGAEEGAPEETEPPRLNKLDVTVGEPIKIEGEEARCLEWRLNDEPAQRAYYLEKDGSVLCAKRILGSKENAHEYVLAPPQPVLQKDLDSPWTWAGKVGTLGGKQRFELKFEDQVSAGSLGKLDCVVILTTFSGDDESSGISAKWLSPGIGLVREETEVKADQQIYRTVAVLTKYETGKK